MGVFVMFIQNVDFVLVDLSYDLVQDGWFNFWLVGFNVMVKFRGYQGDVLVGLFLELEVGGLQLCIYDIWFIYYDIIDELECFIECSGSWGGSFYFCYVEFFVFFFFQ